MGAAVRVVGAVLIVVAGAATGDVRARAYLRRRDELASMLSSLQLLETQLNYTVAPLQRALSVISQTVRGPVSLLLRSVSEEIGGRSGRTVSEIWQEARRIQRHRLALKEEDLRILDELFAVLGTSGRDDQLCHVRLCRERLALMQRDAAEQATTYPRMCRYLGVMGALVIVLLLA